MRSDLDNKKQEIIEKINAGASKNTICKEYRCKFSTLNKRLTEWNITVSTEKKPSPRLKSCTVYITNKAMISSSHLKKKLIKEGLKKDICEICGICDWIDENNKQVKLSLHLDHINGNHYDNSLENLRVLCPNCHSLTATYGAKNKTRYDKIKNEQEFESKKKYFTDLGVAFEVDMQGKEINKKIRKKKTCLDCNVLILDKSTRCRRCFAKHDKISWPSNEELKTLVWNFSFVALAKQMNVSDVAIRKRCENRKINIPPRGYWRCREVGMTHEQTMNNLCGINSLI